MENQEKATLNRVLKEQHFEDAEKAIKGGEETGGLHNLELIKELVEKFKGKTVQAPIEVITTSTIFLNAREIMGTIEALKHILKLKMLEELEAKAERGEATTEDAMTALMLSAIMRKESKKD